MTLRARLPRHNESTIAPTMFMLRSMSWSDEYIRDLRGRLAEAKRQGLWVSAQDVQFVRHLLSWWTKANMTGFGRPSDGAAPTIGGARRQGVTHLFVRCDRPGCHQSRRLSLDDLHRPPGRQAMPDHVVFLDIPNVCRFRCLRCGSRAVSVVADRPTGLSPEPYRGPDPMKSTWS